jgi:hypothetical protein
MKSIIYKSLALVALLISATSCSDDIDYKDLTPSPVTAFYEPVNGKALKLVASNSATLLFEWEAAHAVDGTSPQYEVAFYKADDTTNPIYKVTSDNTGAKPLASISHKTLAKIMAAAGFGMGETGTIKWGVISYCGVNGTQSTVLNELTLTRFIGFDEIPNALYITGEGSETGADLSKALAFTHPDSETFEIFTQLTAGKEIYFTSDLDGSGTTYSLKGSSVVEGEDGGTYAESTGVYRIQLDFTTASVTLSKINHLYMRFTDFDDFTTISSDGNLAFEYDYVGNGEYHKETTVTTKDTGWSWDPYESRYNLLMVYDDGTEISWAPTNTGLDNKPGTNDISSDYFNMQEYSGRVSTKWKLADVCYNVPCDFNAYFNGQYGTYKHFQKAK